MARTMHRLLTELVAFSGACRTPRRGLRVLMYHSVGGRAEGDRYNYYSLPEERFAQHVLTLCDADSLSIVPLGLEGCTDDRANVAITFDDGYRDNLLTAAPMLVERKMPFTVFVATRFVRERHPDFLSPGELCELAALPGVTIGAHGNTHVPLAHCDEKELAGELSDSKAYLEDLMGREVKMMSYPHGSVDRRVRNAVATAGYELAACSHEGVNRPERDPLLLLRTTIFAQDNVRLFRQKLDGCGDWYGYLKRDPAELSSN